MTTARTYSPFGEVSTSKLSASDLSVLSDVPEGWFIEYKRDPCKSKDYAKEVSAFANAMGGWVFIGLEEDSSNRKPIGGPGLPVEEASRFHDAARDAIVQNISPAPRFELAVVRGPIAELKIPDDRFVLVIRVPESQNTPHIHCSGRIYRRQADKSDPVEINDRAELDALYKRAERLEESINRRLDLGFDEKWAELFDTPWLHCALVPEPIHSSPMAVIKLETFRKLISSPPPGSIELPDVYSTSLGYVARNHRTQSMPHGPAQSLEYGIDGSIYITMPLSYTPDTADESISFLSSTNGVRFCMLLKRHNLISAAVIDCTHIAATLTGMFLHVQNILKAAGISGQYRARIRMKNIFRCVPFFDSKAFVDLGESHSVPIVHRSEILIPSQSKGWFDIKDILQGNAWVGCMVRILYSLGLGEESMPTIVEQTYSSTYQQAITTIPK